MSPKFNLLLKFTKNVSIIKKCHHVTYYFYRYLIYFSISSYFLSPSAHIYKKISQLLKNVNLIYFSVSFYFLPCPALTHQIYKKSVSTIEKYHLNYISYQYSTHFYFPPSSTLIRQIYKKYYFISRFFPFSVAPRQIYRKQRHPSYNFHQRVHHVPLFSILQNVQNFRNIQKEKEKNKEKISQNDENGEQIRSNRRIVRQF